MKADAHSEYERLVVADADYLIAHVLSREREQLQRALDGLLSPADEMEIYYLQLALQKLEVHNHMHNAACFAVELVPLYARKFTSSPIVHSPIVICSHIVCTYEYTYCTVFSIGAANVAARNECDCEP